MEYFRTNNLNSAKLSLQQAKEINPNDPLILNEIGAILLKQKNYAEARDTFIAAVNLCDNPTSWVLETIFSNLAQTYRKMK